MKERLGGIVLVWVSLILSLLGGCVQGLPLVRPTELASPGGVVAAAGGQIDEDAQGLGSAMVGVGVAPHVQLEGAGSYGQTDRTASLTSVTFTDVWSAAAGVRGELALGKAFGLQLGAGYLHQAITGESFDAGKVDVGAAGAFGDSGLRWGLWIDDSYGELAGAASPSGGDWRSLPGLTAALELHVVGPLSGTLGVRAERPVLTQWGGGSPMLQAGAGLVFHL